MLSRREQCSDICLSRITLAALLRRDRVGSSVEAGGGVRQLFLQGNSGEKARDSDSRGEVWLDWRPNLRVE